jgi:hypothetical protein
MLVAVRDEAVTPVGALGACASAHAGVDALRFALPERFPAASTASTLRLYVVPQERAPSVPAGDPDVAARVPFT